MVAKQHPSNVSCGVSTGIVWLPHTEQQVHKVGWLSVCLLPLGYNRRPLNKHIEERTSKLIYWEIPSSPKRQQSFKLFGSLNWRCLRSQVGCKRASPKKTGNSSFFTNSHFTYYVHITLHKRNFTGNQPALSMIATTLPQPTLAGMSKPRQVPYLHVYITK